VERYLGDHDGYCYPIDALLKVCKTLCLVMLLVVVFLLSFLLRSNGLASEKPSPIILKCSCPWGPTTAPMVRRKELVQRIQEKSQGRIRLELYGVGELCQSRENFEAVRTGVADVAYIISAYTPGLFPWSHLIENPFFALPLTDPIKFSYKAMSKIAKNVNPEFEHNGVVPSGIYWLGGTAHVYSKKPLQKIEDFKKVRISCISDVHSKALKRLGFSPQMIAGADTYVALQKGIVDAALQTHGGAKISRYEEVTKYVSLLNWPQLGFTYVFNPSSLKKLPPDLRDILINEFRAWHEQVEIGEAWQREQEDLKWLESRGVKVITLPREEIEKIRKSLPNFDEWAAEKEKYGMRDVRQNESLNGNLPHLTK
jgi:TRAP-type transport system periplasmic protein